MFEVLTYNNISPQGLARLPSDRYLVGAAVSNPHAIILRSFDLHTVAIQDTVKCIGRAGAGVNNIPVSECSKRGIPVFNAPGANANAVKELTIAAMLIASRNLCAAWDFTKNLSVADENLEAKVEAAKKSFAGNELAGKTLGIIGLGAIGVKLANTALALGMRVIGYDPLLTVDSAWQLSSQVLKAESLEEALQEVDFLTIHVPFNAHTRHLINSERLKLVKADTVILNFSRDGIVEDESVLTALQAGLLKAYVCDFPTATLINQPGVLLLPHLGASTDEAETNCAIMVAEQIRDFLENGNIRNAVNLPEVSMSTSEGYRIAIVNQNVPNMVGQITAVLGEAKYNINNLINKSKGEYAYTLLDIDSQVQSTTLAMLQQIPGVLSVRMLSND